MSSILKWDKDDRHNLIAAFLVGLIVYGYPISNFALHIDGEFGAVGGAVYPPLTLGRWGITLLKLTILPDPFAPFFTTLLSVVFYCLSGFFAERSLGFSGKSGLLFIAIYTAFPQFAYQLEFILQSDCVALGLLLSVLSYFFMQSLRSDEHVLKKTMLWVASVSCLTLGTATYQCLFLTPLCLSLCAATLGFVRIKLTAKQAAAHVGSTVLLTVVALIVYKLIDMVILHTVDLPNNDYLNGMIGWRLSSGLSDLYNVIKIVYASMSGHSFYGISLYETAVIPVLIIALRIVYVYRSRYSPMLAGIVVLCLASLSAFAMVVLLGKDQAARVFMQTQIPFAALWSEALSLLPPVFMLDQCAGIIAICVGCLHVSRLFYSDTASVRADQMVAQEILQRVHVADPQYADGGATKIYFHGAYAPPNMWRGPDFSDFGGSFFSWDGGNNDRIRLFFKVSGIADFQTPSASDVASVQGAWAAMPVWPNPASVTMQRGIVLVKLGN